MRIRTGATNKTLHGLGDTRSPEDVSTSAPMGRIEKSHRAPDGALKKPLGSKHRCACARACMRACAHVQSQLGVSVRSPSNAGHARKSCWDRQTQDMCASHGDRGAGRVPAGPRGAVRPREVGSSYSTRAPPHGDAGRWADAPSRRVGGGSRGAQRVSAAPKLHYPASCALDFRSEQERESLRARFHRPPKPSQNTTEMQQP